ncbi:MAG TPA: AtaL-like protein [Geobacteraceae bacterium]
MLVNTYRTLVHAQIETVWKLLLDRVENPQHYLHGVDGVQIIERSEAGIVREISWEGKTIRERIVPDRDHCRVTSELLEHPLYRGTTVTRAVSTAAQNPMAPLYLETGVRLERKSFHVEGLVKTEEEMVADIEKELRMVKEKAEEAERRE